VSGLVKTEVEKMLLVHSGERSSFAARLRHGERIVIEVGNLAETRISVHQLVMLFSVVCCFATSEMGWDQLRRVAAV